MKSILVLTLCVALGACATVRSYPPAVERPTLAEIKSPETRKLIEGAIAQTKTTREYTQQYFQIAYPNGDVPANTGACVDVVIRGFRHAGIDLQKEVHEDMAANFSAYPNRWGLSTTDTNIDHRRVPNLQTFFTRKGKSLAITRNAVDYQPGDVVVWDSSGNGTTHIGMITNLWSEQNERYLIVHNFGAGANIEDRLFDWEIKGHYRYF